MPLNIIKDDSPIPPQSSRHAHRKAAQATWDRRWLQTPEKYNPKRNALERTRIKRTWSFLEPLNPSHALDIGCGYALLAKQLAEKQLPVTAADISSNALKQVDSSIPTAQAALPETNLEDDAYDLIICADVIAEIDPQDRRLAISELCRLLKKGGKLIISTPIDIYSKDAMARFCSLIETEFRIQEILCSYHGLALRLPQIVKKSDLLTTLLEKLGYYLFPHSSLSHTILLCTPKPLFSEPPQPPEPARAPFEKTKKWE